MPWRALEVLLSALPWADAGSGRWIGSFRPKPIALMMPVSSQVSVVPGAVHGDRGVLL